MASINCNIPEELLPFEMFGFCLQEPMALVLDTAIAVACFIFYFKLRHANSDFQTNWRIFFFIFGISTFLGGFGHLLYNYTGIYGKMPTWILAIIANYFPGKAMLSLNLLKEKTKKQLHGLLIVKMIVFFFLMMFVALYYQKNSFVFVMVDSAITFLVFCLGLGISFRKRGVEYMKYIIYGVLALIPSIFIFIFEVNLSLWFNKDDFSHVIMIITLTFFYFATKHYNEEKLNIETE